MAPKKDGTPHEISTRSPRAIKARAGVMEFLLINHPLDCPICDQGGECDLQDQAMGYGRAGSRYSENKRAVDDKNMGPLVKTIMTRCIQCTRCVRFATEVAGVPELGLINRGEDAEITTYLEQAVTTELAGNLVDVCPVGALTSRPYAFNARPWELKKTESIDVHDALGAAIRIDAKGPEVMRIQPRVNEAINEEWLADKSRHAVDGLMRQRLDRPYVRIDGKLRPASWAQAFAAVAARLTAASPEGVGVIAGDLCAAEEMKAALDLFGGAGVKNIDCRQDGVKLGAGPRASWLFNSTIAGIEDADVVLLVGTNPRLEAPLLNARLRKGWLQGKTRIGLVGAAAELSYPHEYLGAGPDSLRQLGDTEFGKAFAGAKTPAVILGAGALARGDGAAVAALAGGLAPALVREGWNGINVLHSAASRVGGLDMGFVPREGGLDVAGMLKPGALNVLYLLGADEIDTAAIGRETFVVYQGSHGDAGANRADVILPGAAYTEKPGIYVNTEGRVQLAPRAVFPKGEAKEDWTILRALSAELGAVLPYDTLDELRAALMADHPTFAAVDYVQGPLTAEPVDAALLFAAGEVASDPFRPTIVDYYQTNPVARASVTMAECSQAAAGRRAQLIAAE